MSNEEKLSALSQLIALARTGDDISTIEYNFLLVIANQIGVNEITLNNLLKTPYPFVNIKHESQRIVQFHRLLLLMNVDHKIATKELNKIHQLGLKMGLDILAIDKTLEVMKRYDNNNIPPDVLLDIFKTYYN
jgi:hypothetical protein